MFFDGLIVGIVEMKRKQTRKRICKQEELLNLEVGKAQAEVLEIRKVGKYPAEILKFASSNVVKEWCVHYLEINKGRELPDVDA